ncbi:hypothetical protein N7519_007198 [Penicillium mononematosum]|uniref:uncharacterized protein n=1 Tax=Penicillium mononematosum TaxID=268346 RepID=UPI0025473B3E|nr:uncharacterized protein N7519_007198 [Penicillium mononematosum]KAJ6185897.1 hypothetical protein N7519_007198 [Penicillium mononematosum]
MGSVGAIADTFSCLDENFELKTISMRMMPKPLAVDTLEDLIDNTTVPTTTSSPTTTATIIGYSVTESTTTAFSFTSTGDTQILCPSDAYQKSSSVSIDPLGSTNIGVMATIEHSALISEGITTIQPAERYEIATSEVTGPTQPASKASLSSGQDERRMVSSLIAYTSRDASPPHSAYVESLAPIWIDQLGPVSAQWFEYPSSGPSAVGVKGIYGCTAVIIVSEKGVYIAHIWENPVFVDRDFNPTDDNSFTINVFNSLRDGTEYAQSVTGLIGTDQNPGVLNTIYAPKVFVLTPFTTDWDRQNFGISTTLRYQTRVQDLVQKIASIVPGSGGNGIILGYTRTSRQASSQEPGIAGRAILEIDPSYARLTTAYDSKSTGLQIGRWRLWVEDQLITYQDFWLPHITAPWALTDEALANTTNRNK